MSARIRPAILALLAASGAVAAAYAIYPPRTVGVADSVRSQLDQGNTKFERDRLSKAEIKRMDGVRDSKLRQPWRETEEERKAMRTTGDGDWRLRNEGE